MVRSMSDMALNPRAEILLKALIERYISDGQPVGSRTLARDLGNELSPATIRNVMADLEELGLIQSPHTSAGRIPTALGYRVFVDTLLKVRPIDASELRRLEGELSSAPDPQQLMEAASSLLSQVTRLAGVVMLPRQEQAAVRQIEFLQLSANRVLAILVTQEGRVHNRVIVTDRTYSPAELVEAANFFNDQYAGRFLSEVKQVLLAAMQQDSDAMQRAMRTAMTMARHMFTDEDSQGAEIVVSGESNLLEVPELGDVRKLRRLFDTFNTKRDLLHLLDQCLRTNGVQIFIGGESGYQAFEECSVVASPYQVGGRIVGMLGVIGPTRMSYEHVIPIVDVTARLLGGALSADRS
jgi:heat-inducible transcriptional repressor